jgi:hypothetical protein
MLDPRPTMNRTLGQQLFFVVFYFRYTVPGASYPMLRPLKLKVKYLVKGTLALYCRKLLTLSLFNS